MIDLDPGAKGTRGQVLLMDRLWGPSELLANSLSEWLNLFVDDLEDGKYVYDDDAQSLIHENDW